MASGWGSRSINAGGIFPNSVLPPPPSAQGPQDPTALLASINTNLDKLVRRLAPPIVQDVIKFNNLPIGASQSFNLGQIEINSLEGTMLAGFAYVYYTTQNPQVGDLPDIIFAQGQTQFLPITPTSNRTITVLNNSTGPISGQIFLMSY